MLVVALFIHAAQQPVNQRMPGLALPPHTGSGGRAQQVGSEQRYALKVWLLLGLVEWGKKNTH